jgi:hypothetical protein
VNANPETAVQIESDLKSLVVIRRGTNGFVPANRSAILGASKSLSLAYATVTVTRLVRTMIQNFAGKSPAYYERQVSEVRISKSDLPVFLRFVEQQGQYLIDAVDDWLSRRHTASTNKRDTIAVGLGAFAWIDEQSARDKRITRRSSRRIAARK